MNTTHPFGVATRPQSYRNIAYLLLGLPLGTLWFAVIASFLSVALSLLVIALLGIPMLWALWYATRAFANVERGAANTLLGTDLPHRRLSSDLRGNVWVRLRSMSGEHERWQEFGYLVLRFPAGIATFTAAVTALGLLFMVAAAPFTARFGGPAVRRAGWELTPGGRGVGEQRALDAPLQAVRLGLLAHEEGLHVARRRRARRRRPGRRPSSSRRPRCAPARATCAASSEASAAKPARAQDRALGVDVVLRRAPRWSASPRRSRARARAAPRSGARGPLASLVRSPMRPSASLI